MMRSIEHFATKANTAPAGEAQATRTAIQKAAVAAGMTNASLATDAATTETQVAAISDYLLGLCNAESVAAFRQQLTTAGVPIDG
jgi:hypothetical protein